MKTYLLIGCPSCVGLFGSVEHGIFILFVLFSLCPVVQKKRRRRCFFSLFSLFTFLCYQKGQTVHSAGLKQTRHSIN